ncbi:MAG: histidinol-phosphate/aromatic aminotransferase/cobyric acid decarboxylase-like protein [Planctomycetota bacterium]|jgi:histidinol-phosphate/aromatic aminotransferase/cobyric acid decarboxylase-like protein
MENNTDGEKDRFFSRLATIPGLRPMPSVGSWILIQVERPSDLARKVNRRLEPGVMSVPRGVDHAVRVQVGEPKENEKVLRTLRDLVA